MDDPILLSATAFALIFIPVFSWLLAKIKLKFVFILPSLAMIISFPMFLLVVILQGTSSFSLVLFIISMSMWTGGFFGIFFSIIYYYSKKNNKKIQ